jgi:hypothetical protein
MHIGDKRSRLARERSPSGDLQETSPDRRACRHGFDELIKTHVSDAGARCGFAGENWACWASSRRAGEVLAGKTDPALGWVSGPGEMRWDARGQVFARSCLFCLPRPTRLHVVTRNVVRTTASSLPALTAVLTAYTRLIFANEPAPEGEGDILPVLSASIELCATMRRIRSDGTPRMSPPLP